MANISISSSNNNRGKSRRIVYIIRKRKMKENKYGVENEADKWKKEED